MKAAVHPYQEQRLEALRGYDILDTPKEADFDDVVQLAAQICKVPTCLISFVDADRQWFKAATGLKVVQTPLEASICAHVILEQDFVEIPDTASDRRVVDNPLCLGDQGFRFYAGAPLKTDQGLPLGTLCVLDYIPRTLTRVQRNALKVLANQVMKQLELRRALQYQHVLRREIDHRVTNSLTTVSSLVRLQKRQVSDSVSRDALQAVENRIRTIALLHRELCQSACAELIDLQPFMQRIESMLQKSAPANVDVSMMFDNVSVSSERASSIAIIANEFAANSFAHAFPEERPGTIQVRGTMDAQGVFTLWCTDDGLGANGHAPPSAGGLGMLIMNASASQLGGECRILESTRGFQLAIDFPLEGFGEEQQRSRVAQ